jgi:hypothetical protein
MQHKEKAVAFLVTIIVFQALLTNARQQVSKKRRKKKETRVIIKV